MDSSIIYTIDQSVAVIRLNRPDVFNSFNREMSLAFQEALERASADEAIRAVYITGTGKAFSAGQDLQEAVAPDGPSLETILSEHYSPIILRIRSMEKPVVAAVNGVAAGAGANMALACDIVVASSNASFIQAFSKIGLVPDSSGTFFLPRLVGFQRSLALMMTGDKVSAAEAFNMGMIYKVFSEESFQKESMELTIKLALMPTKGLALTKKVLNESMNNNLVQQLAAELKYQLEAGETYDFKEGVQAFIEKRPPIFLGK
ncbi:MAG: enoyl-CoA hydratase-related protein [Bacteroidota bacterium]|nr:enoyl-CoA hydratase-related protein [Bacteroidota bacterium]